MDFNGGHKLITEKLITLLDVAIDEFYMKDWQLIKIGVHERTCVARIAHYLQNLMDKDSIYNELSVDFEYNRQTDDMLTPKKNTKKSKTTEICIVPDLIIHKREINALNILVAEFKIGNTSYAKRSKNSDTNKIKALMNDPDKHYWCGVYVVLNQRGHSIERITTEKKRAKK